MSFATNIYCEPGAAGTNPSLSRQSAGICSRAFGLAGVCAAAFFASAANGFAHQAPTGWSYPYSCCSGIDCREVPGKAISERPEGYVINGTGEVVSYDDGRIKDSPDGVYHWCSVAGADDGRTICLFVPPRSF